MSEELKPCPFCGSTTLEIKSALLYTGYVYCRGCETTGPEAPDEMVVQLWNRRRQQSQAAMEPADIKALALLAGFTEREQPNGTMDLNPYVYAFGLACHRAGQDQTDSRVAECEAEIDRLREGLRLITCESINAEAIAENVLDGLPPYHGLGMTTHNGPVSRHAETPEAGESDSRSA